MLEAESLRRNIDSSAKHGDLLQAACKHVVTAAQPVAHAKGGLDETQRI